MISHGDDGEFCILQVFPRNLSYVEESYLDNFSVCADFVKTPTNLSGRRQNYRFEWGFDMSMAEFTSQHRCNILDSDEELCDNNHVDPYQCCTSDHGIEEGIFVNQMEDLDSIESGNGNSLSIKFSNDYTNSSEEDDLEKSNEGQIVSIKDVLGRGFRESENEIEPAVDLASLRIEPSTPIQGSPQAECLVTNSQLSLLDLLSPDSPLFEESEFNFNKAQLRKSSSLKANKTPPGTPRTKKMVRFADAMGLDLESVRHILNTDVPPKIPASAMADLKTGLEEERREQGRRYLDICFAQPGAADNFHQKVMGSKVCLENCMVTNLSITGTVRVANIGFHKVVRVRYTINNWVTFYDIMASYVCNSCDGPTDRFSFTIVAPSEMGTGGKLEFAVSFTVNDVVYWDNNDGRNYSVLCYAKTTPTEAESAWMHFL
ncbi:hypothetical protein ACJMK2_008972 [Sinanodonta woodiana]|uniref:CBM21 domain-containing protein n=1 Tax=Sinanodonta woodiana TaxID=1069815 RepID=A0ABD3VAT4_SINWO